MRRACLRPGCAGYAVPGGRGYCPRHLRSTAERGYDEPHRIARGELERTLPAPCAYGCGTMLHRGMRWVAAHVVDGDPSAGWVAACSPCNQRAKDGGLRPMRTATIVGGGYETPEREPRMVVI